MRPTRTRARRLKKQSFELQLTSMMDMLIILVVFLLKSYSTDTLQLPRSNNLQLPSSLSQDALLDAPHLTVESNRFILENQILSIQPSHLESQDLAELTHALLSLREQPRLGKSSSSMSLLLLQADQKIPYEILRKVLGCASEAGFKAFKLIALKKES